MSAERGSSCKRRRERGKTKMACRRRRGKIEEGETDLSAILSRLAGSKRPKSPVMRTADAEVSSLQRNSSKRRESGSERAERKEGGKERCELDAGRRIASGLTQVGSTW